MKQNTWSRRQILLSGLTACAAAAAGPTFALSPDPKQTGTVTIENFDTSGASQGKVTVPRVVKSDEEWRKQLSRLSYQVTRHEGTEMAFSGEYASNHDNGLYRCICCDTPLFDSRTKFESGTGWPSFYQPISKLNVLEKSDSTLGM